MGKDEQRNEREKQTITRGEKRVAGCLFGCLAVFRMEKRSAGFRILTTTLAAWAQRSAGRSESKKRATLSGPFRAFSSFSFSLSLCTQRCVWRYERKKRGRQKWRGQESDYWVDLLAVRLVVGCRATPVLYPTCTCPVVGPRIPSRRRRRPSLFPLPALWQSS